MSSIVLGPMLRYVDERVAMIWVQTDAPCEVEILGRRETTWRIDDLHFALVVVEGVPVGTDQPYEVRLDGEVVWPASGSSFPPSTIRLIDPSAPHEVVFGSCRVTLPHEPPYALRAHEHPSGMGIDALRAYALRAARRGGGPACPDLLLMLGDQIYADQPSPALKEAISRRERPANVPPDELADLPSTRSPITRRGATRLSAGCCRRCPPRWSSTITRSTRSGASPKGGWTR